MQLEYSFHWKNKRKHRKSILDEFLIYAILNSKIFKDKHWDDALNALCRIPVTGRRLKVVYKFKGRNVVKIITAFWVD